MHNFFTIEVEAEMLRQERERNAAADARAAQACSSKRKGHWLSRAARSLANLPALALPSLPASAPLDVRGVPQPVEC
jgi:hypothetical protein